MKKTNIILSMLLLVVLVTSAKEPQKVTKPIELNTKEFIEKVHDFKQNPNVFLYLGDKPAIVDFYATWCGPCKQLAPTLKALAAEYGDTIYIYKVDIDKEPDIARTYGIRSVPSLLFIPQNNDKPKMGQGNIPKEALKKEIDEFLLGKPIQE